MKKNDIFTFTAPNGAEVRAVVVSLMKKTIIKDGHGFNRMFTYDWLCYAQNRLFTYMEIRHTKGVNTRYGEVLVDYAILPDYDAMLERYNDIEVAQAETSMGM